MIDNLLQRFLVLSALFILLTNIFIPISANFIEKPLIMSKVEETNDEFDRTIINYMNNGHLPSMVLAIVKNKSMVWSKGYGYADIKNNKEATNKTVYMIASISKTFTATAIMQLWEKGLLDLDDDINEYLPFNVRNPKYPEVHVTYPV